MFGGPFMAGRWQVFTWPAGSNEAARSDQGCFETAEAAKKYIKKVSREHPERIYKFEEGKHREHQS
jgi:hypothetical protein